MTGTKSAIGCQAPLLLIFVLIARTAGAEPCRKWGEQRKIGEYDVKTLEEASGLAWSREHDRLYHVNDSGDGPYFYLTDLAGGGLRKIKVSGFQPEDAEALGLGPCRIGGGSCLYIGDIGDNPERRRTITIAAIREVPEFPDEVDPVEIIVSSYPDGRHNAEGLAVHPNGDLYIVTKKADPKERKALPAGIYRLPKGSSSLVRVGEIDVPWINYEWGLFGQLVTGFDIDESGKRFLILTYDNAIEFRADLSGGLGSVRAMKAGTDYAAIPLKRLAQQESVAYAPGGRAFVFDTEFNPRLSKAQTSADLNRVDCE